VKLPLPPQPRHHHQSGGGQVQVLNEIVMTEKNLINFVLKDVSAQSAAKIAKSSFYSLLHAKLRALHAISKNSTAVRSTDIAVSALGP